MKVTQTNQTVRVYHQTEFEGSRSTKNKRTFLAMLAQSPKNAFSLHCRHCQ